MSRGHITPSQRLEDRPVLPACADGFHTQCPLEALFGLIVCTCDCHDKASDTSQGTAE